MSAYLSVPTSDVEPSVRLSLDDLDDLRGLLLAERAATLDRLAEHEAMLFGAPRNAFGAELSRFARALMFWARQAVEGIDETLERLVESHGSCEWCGTVIPSEQRKVIPPGRLCAGCRRR